MFRRLALWSLLVIGSVVTLFLFILAVSHLIPAPPKPTTLGVTFDEKYAYFLGLNPRQVYTTILDDWGFGYVRVTVPWERIEPEPGKFTLDNLSWYLDEADKHGARLMLAIGQKTPRWPECHLPEWSRELPAAEYRAALLNYMKTVVEVAAPHPAVEIWQVENEPFLPFGDGCPDFSRSMLTEEIDLVRGLDPHRKIMVADSGELSTWRRTARAGDLFGTTLYRTVSNPIIGYWSYDFLSPTFYKLKLWITGRSIETAFVAELQAEPWVPVGSVLTASFEEQSKSMNVERLKQNVLFAERIGTPRVYLWGAEWWYWLREKGRPAMAEAVKEMVEKTNAEK